MQRIILIFIGISGFLAVLMGAAATHWLSATLDPADIARIEKAATYQIYHTLALLGLAAINPLPTGLSKASAICFVLGIILFSGSLYAYSFIHLKVLVYITPLGGITLMLGWLCLSLKGFRK